MKQIACENCGKRYDFEKEDFCPKCGAFNQPVKTWGMDGQGNVIRVDGVNERNHAASFVHREVHKEKRVRQATGMDWNNKTKTARQAPPPRQAAPQKKTSNQAQSNNAKRGLRALLYFFIALIVINFLLPMLVTLLSLF